MDSKRVDIHGCGRCRGNHRDMEFVPFKLSPDLTPFTHWALCPTTNEPLLLYFTEMPPPFGPSTIC